MTAGHGKQKPPPGATAIELTSAEEAAAIKTAGATTAKEKAAAVANAKAAKAAKK